LTIFKEACLENDIGVPCKTNSEVCEENNLFPSLSSSPTAYRAIPNTGDCTCTYTCQQTDPRTDDSTNLLLIGSSSPEVIEILNTNRETIDYDIDKIEEITKLYQVKYYDLVVLDTTNQADREITTELAQTLKVFVEEGGKLIIVQDSGIQNAQWPAQMGSIMPVTCETESESLPGRCNRFIIRGKIIPSSGTFLSQQTTEFPSDPQLLATFEPYYFKANGTVLAIAKSFDSTGKEYPAIIEKDTDQGKVIHFNYNPGQSQEIFIKIIDYLTTS